MTQDKIKKLEDDKTEIDKKSKKDFYELKTKKAEEEKKKREEAKNNGGKVYKSLNPWSLGMNVAVAIAKDL